jgi:predicted O-methyltransferase YrrM
MVNVEPAEPFSQPAGVPAVAGGAQRPCHLGLRYSLPSAATKGDPVAERSRDRAERASLTPLGKSVALLSLGLRHPQEFSDRLRAIAEARLERLLIRRPAYDSMSWDRAIQAVARFLGDGGDLAGALPPAHFEDHIRRHLENIRRSAPIRLSHSADIALARFCYFACKCLKPDTVVETGVAYGVTSAYILQALHENGRGRLHSIDLPPLARAPGGFVGSAIPQHLRSRWYLYRGVSRRVLPKLLKDVRTLDFFIHDSLHTHWNMRQEFEAVWPHLRAGGMVIADDIQDNRAFGDLCQRSPTFMRVIREVSKRSQFGVLIK